MISAYDEIIKYITDQHTACWNFCATNLRESPITTEKDQKNPQTQWNKNKIKCRVLQRTGANHQHWTSQRVAILLQFFIKIYINLLHIYSTLMPQYGEKQLPTILDWLNLPLLLRVLGPNWDQWALVILSYMMVTLNQTVHKVYKMIKLRISFQCK